MCVYKLFNALTYLLRSGHIYICVCAVGEERGRISLDKVLVKQTIKKNIFEIRYVPNTHNEHTITQQLGSAVVHTAQVLDPGSIRKHTWILRANKDVEAETWINAINDAQHKLTPELIAQANLKLPPVPTNSIVSTANDSEPDNEYNQYSNINSINKSITPLQTIHSPSSPSQTKSPRPSSITSSKSMESNNNTLATCSSRNSLNRPLNDNNTPEPKIPVPGHTEPVALSSNNTTIKSKESKSPLLFITLEQHSHTTNNHSLQSTGGIMISRNVKSTQSVTLYTSSSTDVIIAILYDGTAIRIPINYISSAACTNNMVTFDNTESSLYDKATVTFKWNIKQHDVQHILHSQHLFTLFINLILPSLTFGVTLYALMCHSTSIDVSSVLGWILATTILYTNISNIHQLTKSKLITLTYISCQLPESRHRDLRYKSSKPTPISVFDNNNNSNQPTNDLLYNNSATGGGSELVSRLPSRPDTVTAAVFKQRAILNRSTRAASTVVENNKKMLNDDEDTNDSDEEDSTTHDDDTHDDTIDHTMHDDQHDLDEAPLSASQLPSPQTQYTHTFDNESNDQPIVKQDYFGSWTESDWTQINIRGQNYMNDSQKIPAGPHVFKLNNVHCVYNTEKITCVSERPNSYANQRYRALIQKLGLNDGDKLLQADGDMLSPLVVVNFIVPLSNGTMGNLILYFTRRIHSERSKTTLVYNKSDVNDNTDNEPNSAPGKHTATSTTSNINNNSHRPPTPTHRKTVSHSIVRSSQSMNQSASTSNENSNDITWATGEESGELTNDRLHSFDVMFSNFLNGTDDYRNQRFKLIPKIVDGGWVVRKVVGGKPGIIAKGVPMSYTYNQTKNYFEITIDCAISAIAQRIMGMVNHQAAKLVVDLTILFQGESADELPEALFGGCRLIHAHLDQFRQIDSIGI